MTNPSQHREPRRRAWLGGIAVSVLGTVLIVIGLVQTTTANPNLSCPDGLDLIAKFNVEGGTYAFEKPSGNQGVVTISNGSTSGGDMRSTTPISAIIVKGGPSAVVVTFSPPQTSAHFSNSALPDVGSGNTPDISNVQFCGNNHPPTTTTTVPKTTTTVPKTTTTTTAPPTTTSTTTTVPATTSTTTTSTTTTVPATTSTSTTSTTTTTVPATTSTSTTSTTTTVPATTSTSTTSTTTTTVPATTSTSTTSTATTVPATTTTEAGTTTTQPVPSTTSTTLPAVTTTTLVAAEPPVVTSTTVVTGLPVDGTPLPRTGSQSVPLIVLGMVLLAIGITFIVIGRASERRAQR